MNNTALRAGLLSASGACLATTGAERRPQSANNTHMVFANEEHEKFYYEKLEQARYQDCYHKGLIYILGISDDTRYFLHRGCVQTICEHAGISVSTLYRWKSLFLVHKALWLGVLENLKLSAGAFLDGMDGALLQGFCRKFSFSFLFMEAAQTQKEQMEVAQMRFGVIAPLAQGTYTDASMAAYCRWVALTPQRLPDGRGFQYKPKTVAKWYQLYEKGGIKHCAVGGVQNLPFDKIDIGFISLIPELYGNPEVQAAVKSIIERVPDKEVMDYSFQLCLGWLSKNLIDLARTSEYNKGEVIYLLGMAFAFPIIIKGGLWLMDTEIKNAVSATDQDAQYDDKAKRLLGNKIILAHILVKTVDEFRGMNPKDVVSYIEGEPFISVVPVEPGLTNAEKISSGNGLKDGQRIVGLNTENAEINEGLIRFDIIFYVRMKDGISQVIVNVEAQKDEPTSYHILNRAVFYVSRLVSSQK